MAAASTACSLRPERRPAQAGMALVAALLVAALATLLATRLLASQDDFVSLAETERSLGQARRLALGGVDLARAILAEDTRLGGADHLGEAWATPVRETPVEGGSIAGQVSDAQARFNLATLVREDRRGLDAGAILVYRRLLAALQLPPELADAAAAWVARQPAGAWLDLESLAQVEGYSGEVLERLRPHAGFLPVWTQVNVNTATAPVLAAVAGLPAGEATALAAGRLPVWFRNAADFRNRAQAADGDIGFWSASSDYFEVTVTARHGRARQSLRALLHRGQERVEVLALRLGD